MLYGIHGELCEVEDYNVYKRVLQVKKLLAGNPASEDPCQRVDYTYDQGAGGVGRITRVSWGWTQGQVLPGLIAGIPCPVPGGFNESYTYNSAGRMLSKTLQHMPGNISRWAELKLNYTYDSYGQVTSVTYPFRVLRGTSGSGRPAATMSYDSMGRMSGITWTGVPGNAGDPVPAPVTVASGAVYDARNALTSLNMLGVVETRQFNVLGQLTRITQAGAIDIEYRFSATANDGKITSQKNWISGEEVTYQYDELERLSTATTTGPEWGLSWSYDGFGNRLSQSVTKGSGPTSTTLVDPTTNRLSSAGFAYDSNGNMTAMPQLNSTLDYDRSNRATTVSNSNGSFQYAYAPDNRRIWFKTANNDPFDFSLNNGERFVLYSTGGQKMGTYKLDTSGGPTDPLGYFAIEENIYWGGKLVARHNANAGGALQRAIQDRLSSEGTFFPFGEYRSNSSTMGGSGREAFATYTRDSQTGLDYAEQRYYASGVGRFTSVDPVEPGELAEPASWNFHSYVHNDPMNLIDPSGLVPCGNQVHAESGMSVASIMSGNTDFGLLAIMGWHEAGPVYREDLDDLDSFGREQGLVISALLNRWGMANGRLSGFNSSQVSTTYRYGSQGTSLRGIVMEAAGNNETWGIFTNGRLRSTRNPRETQSPAEQLSAALGSDSSTTTCYGVMSAISHAHLLLTHPGRIRYGIINPATGSSSIVLSWNKAPTSGIPPGVPRDAWNYGKVRDRGNTWFGLDRSNVRRRDQEPCRSARDPRCGPQ